jgi:hypothetical protein
MQAFPLSPTISLHLREGLVISCFENRFIMEDTASVICGVQIKLYSTSLKHCRSPTCKNGRNKYLNIALLSHFTVSVNIEACLIMPIF